MKTWLSIFNLMGVGALLIIISTFYIQLDTGEKEYDTYRLNQAIEYAGEMAFCDTLSYGSNNITYLTMEHISLNPEKCLTTFEDMIALNYGMSPGKETREYIESCIPSALLAGYDGYYITLLSGNDLWESFFHWSPKLPYVVDNGVSCISVCLGSENWIKVKAENGAIRITRGKSFADMEVSGILSKKVVKRAINTTLTDALSRNIDYVSKNRGIADYNIYLPAAQTGNGLNDIQSPSLIILLQNADFSGQAQVTQAVISGMKAVRKIRIVGYLDETGQKKYCYESQIPGVDMTEIAVEYFNSTEKAATAGYQPDYRYLFQKIQSEL